MQLKLFFTTLAAVAALNVQAAFVFTNNYSAPRGKAVNDEQWIIAAQADVSGTFENDLAVMVTQNKPLALSGIYQGNVWASSYLETSMEGSCERNLRVAGMTVKIEGHVAGNLWAAGDTVVLGTNALIRGNVIIRANSIVQEGTIEGDADLSATRIMTFGGTIQGDTTVLASDLVFSKGAQLEGDFEYMVPKELFLDDGIIKGEVRKAEPEAINLFDSKRLMGILISFLAAMMVAIPFLSLFPMTTAMSTQLIKRSPGKCILVGIITFLGLLLFGVMCFSSFVSMPLGILLLGSWGAMIYLSRIILGLVIGNLIMRKVGNSMGKVIAAVATGLAIIYLSSIFPIIGVPAQIIVVLLGMGSFILALIEKRRMILQVPNDLKKLQKLRDEQYNPEEDKS